MTVEVSVSELFRDFESDFERLRQDIDDGLEGANDKEEPVHSVEQRLGEAERRASEAEKALKQMEMEARMMPPDSRASMEPKLREFRSSLVERKKALGAAKQAVNRRILLGPSEGASVGSKTIRDRERLLSVDEQLRRSSNMLDEAQRQAADSEHIGINVMSDLHNQRDVINHLSESVSTIGDNMGRARHLLGSLTRRAAANRFLLYVAVVIMGVLLLALLWVALGEPGITQDESSASERPVAPPPPPSEEVDEQRDKFDRRRLLGAVGILVHALARR